MTKRTSPLQHEIRQSKPFGSDREEATLAILRTADIVRRRLADFFQDYGLTSQQYNVLRILRGAGEDGLPTLAVGERMLEQTPGVTRLVDRLVKKGWVRRERSPEDRRQVFCFITSDGLTLLASLDEPVRDVDARALGQLPDREVQGLLHLLESIRMDPPARS